MTPSDYPPTFEFTDALPAAFTNKPVLISGYESSGLPGREYLVQYDKSTLAGVFEIRYETSGGPYKQAQLYGHYLAVGHCQYFYLYDLEQNSNILRLEVFGYFGHLYQDEDLLYLADAGSLYCINKEARITWKNEHLGIDGNYISAFTGTEIHGHCQWNPPDGWEDFVLDKTTGKKIR